METLDIAAADELADGQMKAFSHNSLRLLLCRSGDTHYVVDEMCSHEDYSLALGCIREGRIKCSLHGSWFDLKTGEPKDEPACEAILTYPVKQNNGRIFVEI